MCPAADINESNKNFHVCKLSASRKFIRLAPRVNFGKSPKLAVSLVKREAIRDLRTPALLRGEDIQPGDRLRGESDLGPYTRY